jgi:hypothetical protein
MNITEILVINLDGDFEINTPGFVRRLMAFAGGLTKRSKTIRPDVTPWDRPAGDVEPADSYEPDAPVWAHVGGGWCYGRVIGGLEGSVLVCYFTPGLNDVAVEAVRPSHLLRRKP